MRPDDGSKPARRRAGAAWFGRGRKAHDVRTIGLALGGGGARGLAHVVMLELFDELGVRPAKVAGTSIGAIMAALYCSGISATEIKRGVDDLIITRKDSLRKVLQKRGALKWIDFFDPGIGRGGLINGESFLAFLYQAIRRSTFEELDIPLMVVATDFWNRKQVVFDSGPLLPALQASMAIPGVFTPVRIGDGLFIDGGAVNPVPYDLLLGKCDLTVAIDVMGMRGARRRRKMPSMFDVLFNSFQIMQRTIVDEKLQRQAPDIYVETRISNVQALEFYKVHEIYEQAEAAKAELRRQLAPRLARLTEKTS